MEILNFTLFLKDLVEFKGKKKSKALHKQSFNVNRERGEKTFLYLSNSFPLVLHKNLK